MPPGYVTTYLSLAKLLGTSPRAVATLLKSNPNPILVPCHRVVRSDGTLGGYTISGRPSPQFKEKLLRLEGVKVVGGRVSRMCILDLLDLLR